MIPSDHKITIVKIENYCNPFVSKGRWPWPLHLLNDRKLIKSIEEMAHIAQRKMKCQRDINRNNQRPDVGDISIQATWQKLKEDIVKMAKERSKTMIAPLDKKIKELENSIKQTFNDKTLNENKKMMTADVLGEELKLKLMQRHNGRMEVMQANIYMYSETVCHQ